MIPTNKGHRPRKERILSAIKMNWYSRGKTSHQVQQENLKIINEESKTPQKMDKTLAAIKEAWLQAPYSSLGHILSWIASEDPKHRGNYYTAMDSAEQTGVYALWDINDRELRELATKWKKRQQARPSRKKPLKSFPRIKSIDK